MPTSTELRQRRARIIEQMKEAVKQGDEARQKGEAATDYDTKFDSAEADERAISKQIEAMERIEADEKRAAGDHLEDLEKRGGIPNDSGKKLAYRDAFKQWFIDPSGLTAEMRDLMKEHRGTSTQIAGTANLGGYTIDTELFPEIVKSLKDFSGIAQAATIRSTATGGALYMPTLDDTSTKAVKIGEATSITVQDMTFGQKELNAYKYATQALVSWELMQDSAFDIDAEIRDAFAPRFGRALNETCTVGDGSGDPNGVVTASTLGKTAALTTAFTFPEIIDLVHSVDPAYRMSPTCGFMLHDTVLAAIKKLSIGSGDARPLWQASVREGVPDKIDGFRYWINQDMDSAVTAAKKIMLFGDFRYYVIRMVKELLIIRLNERYADTGVVGYVGHMRWDGECLNTAAIKHLITAAS